MHGGNLRSASELYNIQQDEIIDFSSNVNTLGIPKKIKEIIIKNFDKVSRYPDPESKMLKVAACSFLKTKIPEHNILFGNGSDEIFYIIANIFAKRKVLIPVPTYINYEDAASSAGCKCIFIKNKKENNFSPSIDLITSRLKSCGMLFLGNPNNPTGNIIHPDKIKYILKKCKDNDVFLILDEAFIDFLPECDHVTFIDRALSSKNIIVIRSLTKIFAIPGLRLGFAVAHKDLIEKLAQKQQSWPINCFAQVAGEQFLKNQGFIKKSREIVQKEKNNLYNQLKKISWLKPYKPSVNFILCEIKKPGITAENINTFCAKHSNIIIRDCGNIRGLNSSFFRVAVKTEKENRKLIKCLNDFKS